MNKKILAGIVSVTAITFAQFASAHAVVHPSEALTAAWQEYTLAVPSEKAASTVSIRLVLPDGVAHVSPNVTPGWTVVTKKDPATSNVTEIDWTNGSIPAEQRADFIFQVQNPATAGKLDWKVYQTYSDGTVVSWDQDPTGSNGMNVVDNSGPYSVTTIDAIAPTSTNNATAQSATPNYSLNALILATIALVIALFSLVFTDFKTGGRKR